ncbi:TRAP transporter small permease subunit [Halomonas sp. MCCC 1A11062]|uniref:TRAP transporter small permease n=1 Tax=Halomonas sp. MCCC 1A11062 TaxID=2733485 RepID=UPI001F35D8EE|nr:TRAP transporter small permease subunit [Halomonas sp. MCCC 1A11062]MCE8040402.1 TRAP transporter small permease subunit [Halomonas sp. MCCC 1A11062]
MGLMTIIVSLQVFWRYVLGSSIDSADELSRLFFIWAIFLAIPHGVKHGVHVGIDLFVMMMPVWLRELLFRMMAAIATLLMLLVMIGAWVATIDRWPELMPTLPITSSIYYIAVLICGLHAFLHLALLAWGGSRTWEEAA